MIQFKPIPAGAVDADFKHHFKTEVEQLKHEQLPLQQGLEHSSVASLDDPFTAIILRIDETESTVEVKTGIFFSGIIGGCNCSDDPTPPNTLQEYCEVLFTVERHSGKGSLTLL